MAWDARIPDAYAHHLAALNEARDIIAQRDILNDSGALLIRGGEPLNASTVARLMDHRLMRPLEHQVGVGKALTGQELTEAIRKAWTRSPDLESVWPVLEQTLPLAEWCVDVVALPVIGQKLTVLADRLPDVFVQSCWCAGLAGFMALQMQPPQAYWIFVSALLQDTGYLHLDPATLTPGHSGYARTFNLHPVIAQVLLAQVDALPKMVARAVHEHHERSDGSGFPQGCTHEQISTAGRILSVVNEVCRLRFRAYGGKLTLPDLHPVLRIKAAGHFRAGYEQVSGLLAGAGAATPRRRLSDEQVEALMEVLMARHTLLNAFFALGPELLESLRACRAQAGKTSHAMQVLEGAAQRLWFSVAASGVLSDAILRWIQHVNSDRLRVAYQEMEEIEVVQLEVVRQCIKLHVWLQRVQRESAALPAATRLQALSARMETLREGLAQCACGVTLS